MSWRFWVGIVQNSTCTCSHHECTCPPDNLNMEVYLSQHITTRNWYQIIQIVHTSIQSWIATSRLYGPNRECMQPKLMGKNLFPISVMPFHVMPIRIMPFRVMPFRIILFALCLFPFCLFALCFFALCFLPLCFLHFDYLHDTWNGFLPLSFGWMHSQFGT